MRFLFPSMFYFWAALIAVPIILYLFRPKPKTVKTSTLPFFKWLAREHQDSTWLKRLKYLLSLLFCLLFILLIASALGRLVAAPGADEVKTLVIMIDRSASMNATDGDESRMERAKTFLQNRIAGIPAGVGVIVMAYDNRPEVLLSRSFDMRQVRRAIASVEVRPVKGNVQPAIALANELAKLENPAAIWHATDQPANADKSTAKVELFNFASEKFANVGITALQLRRLPLEPDKFEVFVQVHASGEEAIDTQLEVKLDNELVNLRELTIDPGDKETLLIAVESSADVERKLTLELRAKDDLLPTDNVAFARVPRYEPLKVLWITESPDPFTELALTSLSADGALDILQGKPSVWPPKEPADVVLFDGWLPKEWPDAGAVIIMNPPHSVGPMQVAAIDGGVPVESIRATDQDHPLLFGVSTPRVTVTQTAVVEGGGVLQPVWVGSQGPVLLAGQTGGQRVTVLAFSPERSEQLPLMASYPLLVGNAVYWVAQQMLDKSSGMNRRAGDILQLESNEITWEAKRSGDAPVMQSVVGQSVELDRVGWWSTPSGGVGSASLLAKDESMLVAVPENAAESETALQTSWLSGDLAPLLMWLVFMGLIVESLLYHRYWIF